MMNTESDELQFNPEDYRPEEKNTYDLSMTREEKIRLVFYLFLIAAGIVLALGLLRSGDIVSQQRCVTQMAANASLLNTTMSL